MIERSGQHAYRGQTARRAAISLRLAVTIAAGGLTCLALLLLLADRAPAVQAAPLRPAPDTSIPLAQADGPVLTVTKRTDQHWSWRVQLTFTNAVSEALSDVPVLVVLNSARVDYGQIQDNGQDIRFLDADGETLLPHEIERWNESGNSYVWVKVPVIDAAPATDSIWLWYGNPAAPDGQDPANVWNSGYRMVYHLDENPAPTVRDSSGNGFHGTNVGSVDTPGRVGNAQSFNGWSDWIDLGSDLAVLNEVSAATLSAWISTTTTSGNGDMVSVSRHNATGQQSRAALNRNQNRVGVYARSLDDDSDYHDRFTATTPVSLNTWHHVVAVIDYAGDAITFYVDSVWHPTWGTVDFASASTPNTNSSSAALGSNELGVSEHFAGVIDEVRVATGVRSAGWILGQYRSMTDNLIAFGAPEQTDRMSGLPVMGAPFTYSLTVTNTGLTAATQAVITDVIPQGANYVSGGTLVDGDTVSWTVPSIPVDDSVQVSFSVSTCQRTLLNSDYQAFTSTQSVTGTAGRPLLTLLVTPTMQAGLSYTPSPVYASWAVTFTGSLTTNGSAGAAWGWDFGDGTAASGQTVEHSYAAPGQYTVTLTVTDACGYAVSSTEALLALPGFEVGDLWLVYGQGGEAAPRLRGWDDGGGLWSPENATIAASTEVSWTVTQIAPQGTEELVALLSYSGTGAVLHMLHWDGSTWSTEWSTAAIAASRANKRGFDLAYESCSGDALVVYSNNTQNPVYRTRVGGVWSAETPVFASPPGSGTVLWIELAARQNRNEVALVYSDENGDVHAVIWDGETWDEERTAVTLETTGAWSTDYRSFDAAYESASGDLLVAWATGDQIGYAVKNTCCTDWVPGVPFDLVNGNITFLNIAAEPSTDRIAMAGIDDNNGVERLGLSTWTGTAWTDTRQLDSVFPHVETDGTGEFWAGVGWVGTSGEAVVVYSGAAQDAISWGNWTSGDGWTRRAEVPAVGAGHIRSVQLESFAGQDKVMLVFSDQHAQLYGATYDGSSWVLTHGGNPLETSLSEAKTKAFSFAINGPPREQADLSLAKSVDNGTPAVGDAITFTLSVTNAGPDDATAVALSDPLPALLAYAGSSGQGTYDSATGTWAVGTVTASESITLSLVATVTGPALITNTVEVSASAQCDPNSTPCNQVPAENDQASVTLSSCGSPPRVLFVVGDPVLGIGDAAVVARLQGLGYIVTVVDDDLVEASDAEDKMLILISSTSDSTAIGPMFRDMPVPVVTWERSLFDDMSMTGPGFGIDYGADGGQTQVDVVNSAHVMAAGLSGSVQVATVPTDVTWGRPASSAITIATILTDATKAAIYGYETGSIMVGATTAPARRVGFLLRNDNASILTTDGWTLFDAAIFWAASGSGCGRPWLVLEKASSAPSPLLPGSTITYTIAVENIGTVAATGAVISDSLPDDTTFVPGSIAIDPPSNGTPGTSPSTIASGVTVSPGERVTVTFAVVLDVPLPFGALITNTASVTSLETLAPSVDTVTNTVDAVPDLTISKADGGVTGTPGYTIQYTLSCGNVGDQGVTGAVVTDTVPDNTSFDAGASTPGWSCADGSPPGTECVYVIGALPAGSSPSITFAVRIDSPIAAGVSVVTNTAIIGDDGANGPDQTPADNQASDTTPIVASLDLAIVKDDGIGVAGPTLVFTYTLTASNPSDRDASGIVITDILPSGVTFLRASDGGTESGGIVTWTIPSLSGGASLTRTVAVTVLDPLPPGTVVLTNVTTVADDGISGPDANPADNSYLLVTPVEYGPAMRVVKTGPITATVGQRIPFTFTLTNDDTIGDGSAIRNVQVVDDYAGLATYVSGDDGDGRLERTETWIYTASYAIQISDLSPVVNTVTAMGEDRDGDPVSAVDTHSTEIRYAPDLNVVKLGPDTARIGESVVYTFVLANISFTPTSLDATQNGDGSPIANVAVTDSIAGPGVYVSGDTNVNGVLDVGEAWVYRASYTVQSSDPDPLVNTVLATGQDGNGDLVVGADAHSTDIEHTPTIEVTKVGPAAAEIDETIGFTFTVRHGPGSDGTPISNVVVADNRTSPPSLVSGDDNGNSQLDIGEVWVYTATYTVQSTEISPVVNLCTVTGQDLDGDAVSDNDSHSTVILGGTNMLYLPTVWKNY